MGKWQARRMRHSVSGHTKIVCDACGWVSAEFDEDWKSDLAASAHAENTHGVEAEIIQDRGV